MTAPSDSAPPSPGKNPLIWVAAAVVLLILFLFVGGERGQSRIETDTAERETSETVGAIDRSLLLPPGMRARQYIEDLRAAGKPYPLDEVHARAQAFGREGNLADAHLMYFFSARENHLPSIIAMAEMADPMRFQAQDSLLDHADVIQAYKWYRRAADLGHAVAVARIEELQRWAETAAAEGDPEARQFLLNYQ